MAASKGTADRFSPVRGWVTEGNLADYPQEVAVDIENMTIDKNGLTERRLGIDAESSTKAIPIITDTAINNGAFNVKEWTGLGDDQGRSALVVHSGDYIYVLENVPPLTQAKVRLTIDTRLNGIRVNGAVTTPMHVSIGSDFAVVTNVRNNPVLIEYTGVAANGNLQFTYRKLSLEIRTRELLEPYTNGPNYGTTLTAEEEFNLYNSGWPLEVRASTDTDGNSVTNTNPIEYYFEKREVYPTHSTLFSAMKLSNAKAVSAVGAFSPWEDEKINFGNTIPPLGRFTHSAYSFNSRSIMLDQLAERDDSNPAFPEGTNVGVINFLISSGTVTWSVNDRPRCSGYHNGHVYFADKDREGKTRILVSQLVTDLNKIERCYQEADPSAEEINDLIATDGFTMYPSGMGTVLNMIEFNKGMILLATNGAWQLKGTQGGATATDFTLDKIATFEFNSPFSVVDAGNVVLLWAASGIFALSVNEFGDLTNRNLTEETIDEFYDDLTRSVISNVKGVFIPDERRIYWTVPSDSTTTVPAQAELVLVLNLDTGGFYKYTVSGGPKLLAPVQLAATLTELRDVPVTETDGTIVTTTAGDTVTVDEIYNVIDTTYVGFLTSYSAVGGTEAVFTAPIDNTMYDWTVLGMSTSYSSFVDFAYIYPQSKIGAVQVPYIHSFFLSKSRTLAPSNKSSALMSASLDWSLDSRTKKNSREQQAFKYDTRRLAQAGGDEDDYPYEVVDTKLRVRGTGRTMSIRYRSEEGKDLRLLGYAVIGVSLNDTEGNK